MGQGLVKTLEFKAWREYEFEFSRLPIAITNRAIIRIQKVNKKKLDSQNSKFQIKKPQKLEKKN